METLLFWHGDYISNYISFLMMCSFNTSGSLKYMSLRSSMVNHLFLKPSVCCGTETGEKDVATAAQFTEQQINNLDFRAL